MQVHVTPMLLAATALEDTVALATTTSPATDFLVPSMTSVHLTHATFMPIVHTTLTVLIARVKTDTKVFFKLLSSLVWSSLFFRLNKTRSDLDYKIFFYFA